MFKQIQKATIRLIAGANVATILMMLAAGFSDRIYPANHSTLACLGLSFPIWLLANLSFLIFWIVFHRRKMWIPILGYIACYVPISTYMPISAPENKAEANIKILSFNVWNFHNENLDSDEEHPSLAYIRESEADIVCMQESCTHRISSKDLKRLYDIYPYREEMKPTSEDGSRGNYIAVWSRHPIVSTERIQYPSDAGTAGTMLCRINFDGDTISVFNNHFENCHISVEERQNYKSLVHGKMERENMRHESKLLLECLAESAACRCQQVDSVVKAIKREKEQGHAIILCGDFNDNPISYSHYAINKELTDCFRERGRGIGLSYTKNNFYVRIDNIFCSPHFHPLACEVDRSATASDHYPIVCWLRKK